MGDALTVAPRVKEVFTISDLASEFSVTPRTIRFYEGEGLIKPARRGTQRLYSRGDRARLAWILRGRNVGFSLAEIHELLDLYRPGKAREPQLRAAIAKCRERIAALEAQRADIDMTIAELSNFVGNIETQLGD
ncbi:MerR family transcriptional regulator [Sandaracinobacteroides saxicola]|uniref:MerR family DNA-binding transcriptional regulator n=1 Tax=Sandaracinobacteroides saxicola TaxID=2759707 RepID=A0A7G5ILL4_9SPHN|nr:MerR family DNA-binding transcriptional regulator [Sandaracinobacteroides saxicola]QMW24256.1 MerR family DNA-binding transcriptional regulator [Sandaracinobacteroides saxicola]